MRACRRVRGGGWRGEEGEEGGGEWRGARNHCKRTVYAAYISQMTENATELPITARVASLFVQPELTNVAGGSAAWYINAGALAGAPWCYSYVQSSLDVTGASGCLFASVSTGRLSQCMHAPVYMSA